MEKRLKDVNYIPAWEVQRRATICTLRVLRLVLELNLSILKQAKLLAVACILNMTVLYFPEYGEACYFNDLIFRENVGFSSSE